MGPSNEYTEGLGERVRLVRKNAKLSQAEFGKALGLSRQSINGYETMRKIPPRSVIEKICAQYVVKPWWLNYGVGDPTTEFEGVAPTRGLEHQPEPERGLSPIQIALIEFIKEDMEAAKQLAKQLWKKALKI